MREDEEPKSIFRDLRVMIFIIALLGSIAFIHPGYSSADGFTTNLKYGLDLEGGSWLQVKLQGALVQVDADTNMLLKKLVEPVISNTIEITGTTAAVNGQGQTQTQAITFTTPGNITNAQMDLLGLGEYTISKQNELTQVKITTSKETLIEAYLANSLKAEIVPMVMTDGVEYEIRTAVTEQQIEALMDAVGGSILKNADGSSRYKDGVRTETRDLTKTILSEKMNSLGLKDIPVKTVGDEYILIDFAGIDLSTAREIAEKPGKFEIRIQTIGNETKHVIYGEDIESVGIVGYNEEDGMWSTPFTLNEAGALALQKAAIEAGATTNPMEHNLVMLLDGNEVYSAPLSNSAAQQLVIGPIYSWQSSTGTGDEGKAQAQQLQIHLRAGALPVNVEIMGAGHVDAALGTQFKKESVIAGLIALMAVALVVYRKYHQKEILIPMVGTSLSEVIMILGVASAIGWQLDLPSIAGIIAAIGTGIDHLVIITDEVLYEGKLPPTKVYLSRITKAFSIILAAAATTVIAMGPLVLMGFGSLKGFAITTIIGVFIGVVIARPVYGKLINEVLKGKSEGQA
ncbi:preprotein translocase subunit SecD [uncultured Methanomethylovorans sp.]|jgi:preprotein translocase subunit SecD|uniref:preprotein translocase subunit SecD n=1 Tax=uncultured Methanomethylovorans sp. TaxID=183759 RepID=UPI002631321C|nr:preprotein translocase subunit SecD [uncultured Methanomethylovorans sp.]